ncbi:EthD domain-containing protein [Erythrobacter litoralis]|uniref:EthD domain-containing protein n=1 Tax=Erythrobacter litoralis (strain HTCC2594) TaxID=314225 RepID=Q2N8F2_ERYLH|nr:EthD domain-containing protein [Erythrobacter litoralis]ABC64039.1 hypothetical protein ELI_09735 [Erythrobacter litoralis HTCC2594]
MHKLVYCLHRLPSLSRDEFQHYRRETHAPLVRAAAPHLGIARYIQCHTENHPLVGPSAEARGMPHGEGEEYDGVAEIWLADADANAGTEPSPAAADHARILLEDEARFIDFTRSRMFITRENVVIG